MILLDNIIFTLQRHGGASVVWGYLIDALIRNDIDFECIEYMGVSSNSVRSKMNIPQSRIIGRGLLPLQLERYINPRVHLDSPFIFHSSHYRTCSNRYAHNVTTVHDFTYEYYMSGIKKKVHCWQKYNAIYKSDKIICISNSTKNDLFRFLPDIDTGKVEVIYNGVSNDYKVLKIPNVDYSDCLLYVGSKIHYKNFDFAVTVAKELGKKLLICGGSLTLDEISMLDSKLGKANYLNIVHPSNKQLNEIYNSVFCLLYPSSYEGFGIPVIEAQKAGCPVLALNSSSIPEIIGETPLLINELNVGVAIRSLQLLNNAKTRSDIISSGLENSTRFSWEKTMDSYIQLYHTLL